MSGENNEIFNQYLLEEYKLVTGRIDEFVTRQTSVFNIYLVLIGGAVAFIFASDSQLVRSYLRYVPYILVLIMPTYLYQYHRTIVLQGYRRYLEKLINEQFSKKPIKYSEIAKKYLLRTNFFSILNYIVIGIGCVVLVLVCHLPQISNIHFFIQMSLAIVVFIIFSLSTRTAAEKTSEYLITNYVDE